LRDNAVLYLVIGAIIVALIVTPSLFKTGAKLWDDISDFVKGGWDWTDLTGNGNLDGHSSIGITLFYVDGTQEEYKAEDFSLLPLTLYDDYEREIKQIEVQVWATLTHTFEQYGGFVFEVTDFDAYIMDASNLKVGTLMEDYTDRWESGMDWISSQDKSLIINRWDASEIDALMTGQPQGQYSLSFSTDLTIALKRDETQYSKSASGTATLTFQLNKPEPDPSGQILSLKVTIGTYRLYK